MSRTNIENIVPLSPMQQGMLFDTLVAAESGVYFVQIGWTLRGGLDVSAFLRAWQAVVDRHSILRTGFAWERLERPMAIVRKRATLPVHEEDLRTLSPADQAARLDAYAAEDRRRGFDLQKPPLLRVALFRLEDDVYRLLWARHHILLDGWSTPLLVKEVFSLYGAYRRGEDPRLPVPRPFSDYIAWLSKQDPEATAAFWKGRLAGFSAPTPLRVDHAPTGEARHEDRRLALSEEASARLVAFARQRQITLSTLVQGAFALLLARYSGESDVLFGTTVSGRSAPVPGIDAMVGMFINTLPLRVQVPADSAVGAFLDALHREQLALRDQEHSALVEVQAVTNVPRGTPLFESLVVFENYPEEDAVRQGASGLTVGESRTVEKSSVPLTLLGIYRRSLTLQVSYDARRFDADVAERLLGHVAALLDGLVADPARPLSAVPMLHPAERRLALETWNETRVTHPPERLLHRLVEAQVLRTPDAVAVVSGEHTLTYRELDARANRVAHRLRDLGVGPEVLVGVCLERGLALPVALLAVLKAGGAYVPLDPSYPKERVEFMLDDAGAPVLLTDARLAQSVSHGSAVVVDVDAVVADVSARSERPSVSQDPENLAYVIYTSGSTGRPKGVMIPHRAICNHMHWMARAFPLGPNESILQKTPISFDASVWEIWLPLMCGARLVMARPEGHKDGAYLVEAVREHGITVLQLVPSMAEVLLLEPALEQCRSLRRLFLGGEALTRSLVERWRARLEVDVVNLYGPTECTVQTVVWAAEPEARGVMEPIGRPIDNTRAVIVDPAGQLVPIGVPGELLLSGPSVGRGYLGRPDLTAERFVPDPFGGRGPLYRTGDLCRYQRDGVIEFVGRADEQIKLRGFRIELGEIEGVVRGHPAVREVAVVAREGRLLAYVVPQEEEVPASELRAFAARALPEHMIPSAWVSLGALPLLANGKLDRRALPAPELDGAMEREIVAPRGPVEEAVASIFAEVLQLPAGDIGAHDGFFELGGHSLLATQATSRIRAALGVELPLRAVFEAPTVAGLAARVSRDGPEVVAIRPSPRGGTVPLSFGQERLWFLWQLDPEDTSYNIPFAVRLTGELDLSALSRALGEVVRRHEVLRTTFTVEAGRPVGIVHEATEVPLPVVDLSSVPPSVRATAIREATGAEEGMPFDLVGGPLLRARLLSFGRTDTVLLLTLHHIVSDVWTRGVLNRELGALYDAFRRGASLVLPELPIQYADYAAWQRALLSGERLEAELSYWREQLGSAPRLLELPTDRPRPAVRSSRGARVPVALSAELTRSLRDLCRREGVTLYMLLLAALDVLLYRYTGQSEIVVGSPIAGRSRAETEGLIGFFLNTLVLRAELSDDVTFKQLLARVKAAALGAYAHQDMPFERLVQELDPERDPSRTPLFQVIFNLQNAPRSALSLSGVTSEVLQVHASTAKFDLALILSEGPATVQGSLYYSTDLFDASSVERMVAHFVALLEAAAKGADRHVRDLPMLSSAEREHLLVELNDTRLEFPLDETIVDMFEAVATETPDALALVAGERRLTYAELSACANRLAQHLRKLGVGPDVVVGLCQERTADMIIGILGILKAGGAYVPLEPSYPSSRLAQILGEARSPVLVTQSSLAEKLSLPGVRVVSLDADAHAIAAESAAAPAVELSAHDLCYVLFTSGSTGQPKGVAIEHRNVVNYVHGIATRLKLPRGAGYAHISTFSADVGNTSLYPALCLGGVLHVVPESLVTDPAGLAAYMRRERVDLLKLVPSHLSALMTGAYAADVLPRSIVVLGGEGLRWDLVSRIESLSPNLRILNHYSPTECTCGVLTYPVEHGVRSSTPIAPLGRPLPNSRVYVLDSAMAPVPLGVPGEIYIAGAGVGRGYLGQPELTRERFLADRFSAGPSARIYRSGDRARVLPSGDVQFIGRIDFQVKIRGYRVELGEIEAALAAHPAVKDAVVLAKDDGHGVLRLAAFVVLRDDGATGPDALRAWVAERLPEHMVPPVVVPLDELPLTPNGKVDRKALLALEPSDEVKDHATPRTPVEEVLQGIWADVFERPDVGVDESFADIGGHSLLAIQIIARARDAFGVYLPLRIIFEAPTIVALAAEIEAALREDADEDPLPPITPAPRTGPLPLSFAQERLWFLNQLEPDSPFYNVPLHLHFSGPLDVSALERAIGEVLRRHEVLRSTFPSEGGSAVQIVHPPHRVSLPIEELSALPREERERELRAAASAEVQRPFDLARGPLLRARLLRMGPEEHALLLATHHIVSDAWTRVILHREITAGYEAYSRGAAPDLPDLPIQYGDFAVWQRAVIAGPVLERQLAYWRRQLEGAPPALDLPTDRPRPPVQSYRGAWRSLTLPKALSTSLAELSRREGVTLFMTLLAAFDVVLQRHTGQDDIVVGTPIAGRTRAETEGLIGFFINTLVLRTAFTDELTFSELLGRVRETCIGAYAHQETSFERLVQELSPERDLSRSPLFQVLFTFQKQPKKARTAGALEVSSVRADNPTSKYDMTIAISEQERGFLVAVEYATDLFDRSTIERLLVHYRTVLEGVVREPGAALHELPLLSEDELRTLVVEWNRTEAPLPEATAHALVEAQVARAPDAVAVVFEGREMTYAQLDERANRLARLLRRLGVGPGTLVGLSLPRSLWLPVGVLGVLKAGGAYVPIDPSYPRERVAFMLEDSKVPVLVTLQRYAEPLSGASRLVLLDGDGAALEAESGATPEPHAGPEDLAYVIYTSGSTGKPKGVRVHHRALVNYLLWCVRTYEAAAGRGAPVHSSASFDLTVTALFTPLLVGRTVFMMPDQGEIEALVRLLSEEGGLSFVKITPTHLELLNQLIPPERAAGAARVLVTGGEALTWEMLSYWQRNAPATRIINEYGPTETTVGSNIYEVLPGLGLTGVVSIGKPIANTTLHVLDKRLRPQPIGVRGELYIGGVQVARGYLNRPELTAERFVSNPFPEVGGALLYRSGDLARIHENGEIEFMGRADDQVKVRGYRIELGEIEAVLAQHPGVGETAVLVREDTPGDKRIVAYFVGAVDPAELRAFASERLPDYMVPTAWVALAAMPLTPNGKADRKALPAPEASGLEGAMAAARDPVEEVVAGVWAEVLGLPEVSVHDDFFAVGGHSLLATRVIGRIATALSVSLPLHTIFEAPTVAGLAALVTAALGRGRGVATPPLCPAPRDASLPLSFGQERLWFLAQLDPDSTQYVVPKTTRLSGRLDVRALERALQEIVRRHEILRTIYVGDDAAPTQRVAPAQPLRLDAVVIEGSTPAEIEAAAARVVAADARAPFDLASGPVFRARLLVLAPEDHLLALSVHHIAWDAWSSGVFDGELSALYEAFSRGEASPLPELTLQYADYAAWQRRALAAEVVSEQLAYHRAALEGAPRVLDLPTDRPRPAIQSHHGARRAFRISEETLAGLQELARRQGVTPFMLLLAAFDALLYRWSGQRDLVVGTPIANRGQPETERLIGFFMNTLVLRVDVDGALPFTELVARVKEASIGAYAHQDLPFEQLVAHLSPERDLSASPIFQVMFTHQRSGGERARFSALSARPASGAGVTSKFDLFLSLVETRSELAGSFEYATDLFDQATIERLIERFSAVVQAIVADPNVAVDDLSVLLPRERAALLGPWAGPVAQFPRDVTVPDLFEAQADRTPDAAAVVFGGESLTYRELDRRANQLASFLRAHGVGPDVPVGVCLPRSLALPLAILAVLKAGGAYMALDPEYPQERLAAMMADARPPILLSQASLAELVPAAGAFVLRLDDDAELYRAAPEARMARPELGPDHLAYLVYTSGSTGRPKGVAMTQGPLVNLVSWQRTASPGAFRTLQFASPSFDVCFQELWSTWSTGGGLVLVSEEERRDPEQLWQRIRTSGVERVFLPPVALYQLAEALPAAEALPGTLREIITAGEALQIGPRVAELCERTGAVLRNQYGPSETHVVTEHVLAGAPVTWAALPPIGRPIDNVRVYLLDERRRLVPPGSRGEIYLGGVQVARGYLRQPELTDERFLPDPFSPAPDARMYRTGDLARWLPNGEIEYLGRADFQVKIRGFRVELGEIEVALAAHPDVKDAVVAARDDGPGQRRLVAYVVPSGAPPSVADLRAFLARRLPEYMVPAAYVVLGALPLTSSGKVDRRALPAPDPATGGAEVAVLPRGPVEESIARVFAEVMRLPAGSVGAHAGFFELGGHSLLATQVMSRLRASFGIELPLRVIFEASTPASLAERVQDALRGSRGVQAPPSTPRARDQAPPLSFGQERLWFLAQLDPGDASYNMPLALRLKGPLDLDALRGAVGDLVQRHEVLRTTFETVAGVPVQVVHEASAVDLPTTRLDALHPEAREDALRREVAVEAARPFDLRGAPPIRARLFVLAEEDHALVVVVHHAAADGWSIAVIERELGALYEAGRDGRRAALPPLSVQYADYAAWQRSYLAGDVLASELSYWRAAFEGAPAVLDLPTDRPRPPVRTTAGDRRAIALPAALRDELNELSRREGVTLFMTLLAAFDVLLHRHAGQADVVVGVPIAGRTRPELEGLVGFFVNTLALRVRVDEETSFRGLLHHVKETCLGAYAHQDMPFERLVQELAPERDPSRTPIFQVTFTLQNAPRGGLRMGGLDLRPFSPDPVFAKFDLALAMSETSAGLSASMVYGTDLFDGATIERMLARFETLLAGIVADPSCRVVDLTLLPDGERRMVLADWNATAHAHPRDRLIHEIFEGQVALTPDAVAVSCEGRELTYADLDARANRVAQALRARGVGPETLVGVCMERSPEMVVALYGVLKAGGAYVPLDPEYPRDRLAFMLDDARPPVILTQPGLAAVLPVGGAELIELDASLDAVAASPTSPVDRGDLSLDHLAYVIYTSGSTGRPKGAMNAHRGILNRLLWMQRAYELGADDRVLQKTPFSFDVSVWEFFWPLMFGARLVLARPGGHRDPEYLARLIQEQGVTTLHFVPSMLKAFVDEPSAVRCRSVRRVICSGEALPPALVGQFFELGLDAAVHNLYGPTEAAVDVTAWTCQRGSRVVPIGRPIDNVTVYVLDSSLRPRPVGVPGELFLGGVQVGRGYLRRPELTAERFLDDPFAPGGRLYRTGDLVRWLGDGTIEYLGRTDFQVKIRGFRIELGEIESVLAQHPGVTACAAVAREDVPGDRRIVAYVASATTPTPDELRGWLGERLPSHMVPSAFVVLDRLPLTSSGKVDRRALPAPTRAAAEAEGVDARGPIEEAVAAIFAEVLRAPAVGAHDGFFALGGHSLLAVQVVARLRAAFGVDVPLRALFDSDTPAAIARIVEEALRGGVPERPRLTRIPRVPGGGHYALTFAEERLWFLAQLAPEDPSYVVPVAVRLGGEVDLAALQRAIDALVRRHEALRTTYGQEDERTFAVIHEEVSVPVEVVVVDGETDVERLDALRRAIAVEVRRPFDLACGPLLRVRLFQLGERDHLLFLTLHHIVCDAWAVNIVRQEIEALYGAFASGREPRLPEPTAQVVDFAAWQRAVLTGSALHSDLEYWKKQLGGAPFALDLPTDRPRPAVASHAGELRPFTLRPGLAAALGDLAHASGATLFMTLLAAFEVLLHRLTGQADLLVGAPIVGRGQVEIERTVGLFLNTVVLRVQVDPEMSFRELLARVRETCLGAYAHQDMPFERLVQELAPARDLSRSPLVQVLFTLHTAPRDPSRRSGASLDRGEVQVGSAKVDLSLAFGEGPGGFGGTFEYATDLFDRATIERLAAQLVVVLEGVVSGPDRRVSDLPILPDVERRLVVEAWNDTRADYPREATLPSLVAARAALTPGAIAVTCEGRGGMTYDTLERRSNRLARLLRARGVEVGALVGIAVERTEAMVVGLLGILKAGAAYVPLDPTYPRDRLAFMAGDAAIAALVTESALSSVIDADAPRVFLDAEAAAIDAQDDAPFDAGTSPDSLAYVIYTSGSTGKPKGVQIPHGAVVNFLSSMQREPGFSAADRLLAVTSLSFDIAGLEIWLPLVSGACVEIATRETAADGAALAERLAAGRITVVQATPSTFRLLLDAGWQGAPGLKVLVGGEAVPRELVDRLVGRVGALWNMYGPTETTIWSCVHPLAAGAPVLIGHPIANTVALVLDARRAPVPIGVAGELHLGGDGLARGYLGRPELTAERFVDSPFGRLYRTGDLARWRPQGALEFLGRLDFQVKVRGFRIELGEIEAVLAQHAAVREAVVVAREDVPGEKRLVAYVTAASGDAPSVSALRAHARQSLPDHMVPSAFVVLDRLPLTANNKVDRRALPAPEAGSSGDGDHVGSRGPVEAAIAAIFAEVLHLPGSSVGAHDSFFDLGGHSLLATQAVARVRAVLGVDLPLRDLFESATPAELAARVAVLLGAGKGHVAPPIRRMPRGGATPLSFAQERLWFLHQLDPADASYALPIPMRIEGRIDRPALERALAELLRRHEILRTTFASIDGVPVAVVNERASVPLEETSLAAVPAAERGAALQRACGAEARRPFDLAAGPVVRAALFELAEDDHLLLVVMHHIASDGWSIGVASRELVALYAAFSRGEPSPLPELSLQYADYAAWQRGWLEGAALEAHLGYWRERLAGAPRTIELPTDRPRPAALSHRGLTSPFSLGATATDALRALARREGATLFMVLLAALDVLLYRWSGQSDLLVGTPIAGRTRTELEPLVGFFVNTLVMRAEVGRDDTFRSLLRRVREDALGAYAHQDLPFDHLVSELEPERNLARSPLFQVMFALQTAPRGTPRAGSAERRGVPVETGTSKFDLSVSLVDHAEGLAGMIEFSTDLFDPASIERLAGRFARVLEAIVVASDQPLDALPMLGDDERRLVTRDWNQTVAPFPQGRTAHELFAEQVARTPEASAVVAGGEQLSYAELEGRANQLARHLVRLGVGAESLVGVALPRSPDLVVAILAVMKAGGAYVPLDPAYPADRLAFMMADSEISAVVTDEPTLARLPAPSAPVVAIDRSRAQIDGELTDALPQVASTRNAAYVIYTSGTTGRPKGVVVEHHGLGNLALAQAAAFGVVPGCRVLQFASTNFDASVSEILVTLLAGATLVLAAPEDLRPGPDLVRTLADQAIEVVTLPPSALAVMPDAALPAMRTLVVAGEACPADIVARWAPGRRFINAYGPTEATVCATMGECSADEGRPTIGRPINNVRTYILDAGGQPTPVGVPGELYVGGVGLARGYLKQPALTRERFVHNPLPEEPGLKLYRTGDRCRFRLDGQIEFLGRLDQQVKIRGFRVELGEIEAVLGQHAAVNEGVVIVRGRSPGEAQLAAYVVLVEGATDTGSELRAWLRSRLPEFMVPASVTVIAAMPLSPNGKVDRRALPDPEAPRGVVVAPRTPTEEAIAAIWREVLGLPVVGVTSDFFELGGHSLLAAKVVARIAQAVGAEVALRSIFELKTIAGLAELVDFVLKSRTSPALAGDGYEEGSL